MKTQLRSTPAPCHPFRISPRTVPSVLENGSLPGIPDGASPAPDPSARITALPQVAAVRSAPWLTGIAIVGGFALRKLVAPLIGRSIFAGIERYQAFFQHHFQAYLFFASNGIDIAHILSFLLIGFVVALVARRNEMVATIALALIYAAMAIFASVYVAIKTSDGSLLWRLNWYFADSLAIVLAGAIVRMRRLTATTRPTKPS